MATFPKSKFQLKKKTIAPMAQSGNEYKEYLKKKEEEKEAAARQEELNKEKREESKMF